MPRENPNGTSVRIDPSTRRKLNRFLEHKPAHSIRSALDEAADALLEREGINTSDPGATTREPTAATSAA